MATKKLIERLGFEGSNLFLDGKTHPAAGVLSSLPESRIRVVGAIEGNGYENVYLGTGDCCYGFLMHIWKGDGRQTQDDKWHLTEMMTANLCISDIIPVVVDPDKSKMYHYDGFLITGVGCTGSGVRFVSGFPNFRDVVSTEEYRQIKGERGGVPSLSVNTRTGAYELVLHEQERLAIPGRTRNPMIPSFCLDPESEKIHLAEKPWVVLDITERILSLGVDIEKSHQIANTYARLR